MTGRFPRKFGKYVLLKPLAKGGMGEIYLAAGGDVGGFEKLCVIKKVITEKADRTKANRFLDEAKVVLRLSHAALVNTFDAGEADTEFYIAMELVEGKDLREVWNRCVRMKQRIPLDVALYVVRETARALAYVHDYGDLKLVHRDVAPPNIMLAYAGDVKLTDFGLARSVLKQEHTAPGVVFGRAAYLAPEQARGEVADGRADIYTLGIVLWELLTGQQFLQLAGLDPAAALAIVRHPRLLPPSARAPWVTPGLDHIVMKALSPDRDSRYQSADELRAALTAIVAEVAPQADAARVAEFLRGIYADTIAEERKEREHFLNVEIPKMRAGAVPVGEASAVPVAAAPAPVAAPIKAVRSSPRRIHTPAAPARTGSFPRLPGLTEARSAPTDPGADLAAVASSDGTPPSVDSAGSLTDFRAPPPTTAGLRRYPPWVNRPTPAALAAWRRDAFAAAALESPYIAGLVGAGLESDGRPLTVYEPLRGVDLAVLLAEHQRLDPRRAVSLILNVCMALSVAHSQRRIHGGLSPSSIFVVAPDSPEEAVKVLGFGEASLRDPSQWTRKGGGPTSMGKGLIEYLAPEALAAGRVDSRSDVYALAAVLYELVTGTPPHAGAPDIVDRKRQVAPQSPRLFRPDLPGDLDALILRGLDRRPEARPADATEFERLLRALPLAAALGRRSSGRSAAPERRRMTREAAFQVIAQLGAEAERAAVAAPVAAASPSSASVPSLPPFSRPSLAAALVGPPLVRIDLPPPSGVGGQMLARYGIADGIGISGGKPASRTLYWVGLVIAASLLIWLLLG